MYLCLFCGCIFEHLKEYEDRQVEYFGVPCREHWQGCPKCSSNNIISAFKCEECAEYITGDYYEIEDKKFCDICCKKKPLDGG